MGAFVGLLGLWLAQTAMGGALPAKSVSAPPPPVPSATFLAPIVDRAQEASRLSLEPLGDGGFRYDGTVDERFDAVIRPDGTVVFEVDPSVQIKIDAACLVAICVGRSTKTKQSSRAARIAAGIGAVLFTEMLAVVASGAANPTGAPGTSRRSINQLHATDPIQPMPRQPPPVPSLGGVTGRFGYLPPPREAMSGFLQRTLEFRLKMAHDFDGQQIEVQQRELVERLFRGWGDPSRSLAERKAEILAHWDDLLVVNPSLPARAGTTTSQDLDANRHQAAEEARARILDFVRRHAPQGSPLAFTEDELDAINRTRPQTERFVPYASSSSVPGQQENGPSDFQVQHPAGQR